MTATPVSPAPAADDGLRIDRLSVAYAGNLAVSGLSMHAGTARITGLIGPNGAGKTTTFNACSGLLQPSEGTVHLFGHNVTTKGPATRAQLGLGRTFQRVEVCNAMTVRENITLGVEARVAGANPLHQVFAGRTRSRELAAIVDDSLERCDIGHIANQLVGGLSTGQRRLVELARVLASDFRLILLDEPSSGLDEAETQSMGRILQIAAIDRGVGILLVEHDMSMVMGICEYVYLLDFGKLIFEGTANEAMNSDVVRRAYLGDDVSEDRSDAAHC